MQGYYRNPGANKAAFTNGWFRTGDLGVLDSDGYLSITCRIKELINRGGEKISPVEVDAVLLSAPAVAEAASFGVPDPIYKVFTAFMTGNIVFLGLRTAGAGAFNVVRIAIALAAFSAGGFLARLIAKSIRIFDRGSGVRLREVMISLMIVVIAQLGFLVIWAPTGGWPSNGVADVLVGIWALGMGVQSAAALSFGVTGVFTTAVTGTFANGRELPLAVLIWSAPFSALRNLKLGAQRYGYETRIQ